MPDPPVTSEAKTVAAVLTEPETIVRTVTRNGANLGEVLRHMRMQRERHKPECECGGCRNVSECIRLLETQRVT